LRISKALTKLQAALIVVILIIAAIGVAAYVTIQKPTEMEIKVGILLHLSGAYAYEGKEQTTGVKIAFDMVNEKGGVLGKHKINYVIADDTSDVKTAVAEAERLIATQKVALIVGGYSSAIAMSTSEVCERYGVVYWISAAFTDAVTMRNYTRTFRCNAIAGDIGFSSVLFLKDVIAPKLNKPPQEIRVAIVHEDGPYGTGCGDGNEKAAKALGFNIVLREAYSYKATDLSSLILKLKEAKPDVILITQYYADTLLFWKQAKELGLKTKVLIGHAGPYATPTLWKELKGDLAYVFSATAGPPPPPGTSLELFAPEIRDDILKFKERFRKEMGYEASELAYRAFGLTWVLANKVFPLAITKYGAADSESIRKAAYDIDIPAGQSPLFYRIKFARPENPEDTVLGKMWRTDKPQRHIGQNIYAVPPVFQWINGTMYTVYPAEMSTIKPVVPLPSTNPLAALG
jgi:branched-chain amino acid transport system substrate-binding protein